jgi:hypothetical protein
MAPVAVLEAGTYAYMAWRYETPVTVVAWAFILSSALAAPLLSVYFPMARPLPVTAKDILAQVELASGLGLIRDAVTIANDASASLSQKVALFGASAVMTPQDRERLEGLLSAVERQQQAGATTYERRLVRAGASADELVEAVMALIPSSNAPASTFKHEDLARLRELRRGFLRQHGVTPRDESHDAP